MRILGVDPGLRITGYGVIEVSASPDAMERPVLIEAGVIKTKKDSGIAGRLEQIFTPLGDVIDEFSPEVIAMEKLYSHYKHPSTAILMGHARGVVCLLSAIKNIPMTSMASTHVKKAVTGMGHAGKIQVQRMIQHYLGLKNPPQSADAADALAVAIAYAFSMKGR